MGRRPGHADVAILEENFTTEAQFAEVVYSILLSFPLYPDEYEAVLQRVPSDAADMVSQGERPWEEATEDVLRALRNICHECLRFLAAQAMGSRALETVPVEHLEPQHWAAFIPAARDDTAIGKLPCRWMIAKTPAVKRIVQSTVA